MNYDITSLKKHGEMSQAMYSLAFTCKSLLELEEKAYDFMEKLGYSVSKEIIVQVWFSRTQVHLSTDLQTRKSLRNKFNLN